MAGVNDTPGQHSSNDQPAAAAANRLKRPEQPLCSAKPRQRTVRSWLAGLVLACVLPVWVGAAFLVYRGYQQQRRLMEQHVLETTRALSLVVDGEFAAMEASLTSLATSPFLDTGDLAAFHRQAQAARKGYPGGEIVLATAAGDQLLNTLAPKPFRPPFPNRRNLEVARSVFEGKPFISNLYMGLLQHRLVVSVEVPVIRNGRVLYDLAMTVPASHLEAVFSRQSIPPDWPSGIVDRNHVLVARNMHGEKYVGLPTRVKWAAEAGEGVVEITDREGVPVFAVFSRSPRTGWAVTVGIPKAVMLAGTRQWLWWTVSGAILLSALGIALALFLARRIAGSIQALIAPALALGAGKPVDDDDIGPLGLAETSAVGQSLVKASLLLRQHTAERELAEATIRASHQQLQAIIDGATDTVVFLKDVDGRFITANSRFEKLLGITRGDVQGKTDYDILTKERADYYRAHDRLILTTGQPMQVEEVALLADGKEHIFLANKFPLVDASGKAYAVCAISADITERKQAEEALRESQSNAVFATLADFVPQMVWMCTPDGLNIYFNQRWVEYTGLTLEESYGRGWNTPFHADDKQAAWDAWNHAVQTGEQYHVESRLRAADGSYRWFLMRGAPLRNPAQEIVRWFGTCTDIEELKQAEQAQLVAQRRLTETVVNQLPCCVALVRGRDMTFQLVNPGYQAISPAQEMLGRSLQAVWPDIPRFEELCRRVLETGVSYKTVDEPTLVSRSGGIPPEPVYFSWSMHRVKLPKEDGWGLLITGWETTERKRAEEALIRSEKLASLGRMAATIAHEINNPLAAMTNLLYIAKNATDVPEPVRQCLETADGELRRIAHITRQSLGFYRESNGPEFTSVNAVLESTVDLLKSRIKAKQAVIETQWDRDVKIMAVAGELRQVFSNLLVNSLDAIDEQGTIRLRVSAGTAPKNGHACVRVTIADNGKGINASSRQRLFEPFFTTKGTTGTGLGLWVSKQIIEKHGGTIRMRSRTNGTHRGTAFSVVLPVKAVASALGQSAGV